MVLRDIRDKKRDALFLEIYRPETRRWRLPRRVLLGKKGDAKWAKRIKQNFKKRKRIKSKKNTNKSITLPAKKKVIIQNKEFHKEKDVCSICCEETHKLKYVNCKRGGVQNVNFGKYGECCKDKPICGGCRSKCSKCPFCKEHSLRPLKNRFPQKKPTFAVRQERIRLKKAAKEKKSRAMLRVSVRRSPNFDYYAAALAMMHAPTVYTMDRTPLIMRDSRTRMRRGRGFRED